MRKKHFKIFFLIILINIFFVFSSNVFAEEATLNVSSNNALLMDFSSGSILYEKNINEKIYPASTTKIMTAILVLENCSLNETVTVTSSAIGSIPFGYVVANLKVGETFTVEQMLYSLLVASANDSAYVLAEHVSGSPESFVELMNSKANEIGCKNTHFVDPNGIHDENHYSTAYDLALIAKYAMKNETFKEIVSYSSYKLPTSEFYMNDDRFFATTNEMLIQYSDYYYKYATGIKTGYTSAAGYCLISSAEKNNLSLICVILGAKNNEQKYSDAKSLFEYGYNNYTMQQIATKNTAIQTVKIKNATYSTKTLNALLENSIYSIVKNDSSEIISPEIKLHNKLKAPIKKGNIIGIATYTINGVSYDCNLIASNNVKKSYLLLYIVIVILAFWILIRLIKVMKKNKRKNLKRKRK